MYGPRGSSLSAPVTIFLRFLAAGVVGKRVVLSRFSVDGEVQ